MISAQRKYNILIIYSNFNQNSVSTYFTSLPNFNGILKLQFQGVELYESVITCGMPYFYLARNTFLKRKEEILYKIYLLNTALEADTWGNLIYSNKIKYLDSTERAYLNYYVGMFITKLVSKKIFGFDYLVHLSIAKKYMSIKLKSKSQPDLIAFNYRDNNYSIFETKGRIRLVSSTLVNAKNQLKSIKWISGNGPVYSIISAVYSNSGLVRCHLDDPQTEAKNEFNISKSDLIWTYYEPIYSLLSESKRNEEQGDKIKRSVQIEKNSCVIISMDGRLFNFFRKFYDENENWKEYHNDRYCKEEQFVEIMDKLENPINIEVIDEM